MGEDPIYCCCLLCYFMCCGWACLLVSLWSSCVHCVCAGLSAPSKAFGAAMQPWLTGQGRVNSLQAVGQPCLTSYL
jgi:hypothetical protein